MRREFSWLLVLVLLVGMLLVPAPSGAEVVVTDGEQASAPRYSHRLIVELTSPPLALYDGGAQIAAGGRGKLDVSSPAAQEYIHKLQAEQQAFVKAMSQAIPGARVATYINEFGLKVPATYQILLNAVAVDAGRNADVNALERQLRRLPGVLRVSKDWAYDPAMYASLPLINVQATWDNAAIGGKSNAGAGIKVASMDGGIHKDAPMFSGVGYTYPPGFPKGDTRNTNGKIIVARTYFRTWDPPSAGDENPWPGVLGTSHGTHTASTAAGNEVTISYLGSEPVTLSGVAPAAYVMSYRVFYNSITNNSSFYTTEGLKALEDIVADGADVLNNSWGGGPGSIGGEFDALDQALINAVQAGVFVSMSNGNAGPGLGTGDHPSPDYINVAASTTSGTFGAGRFKVTAPEPVPADLQNIGYASAQFGAPLPIGTIVGPFYFLPARAVNPANVTGCQPFPAGAFDGKAAVISRGGCQFSVKVLNAQRAGAVFAVIYNNAGDGLVSMAPGAGADQVTISSIFIGQTNGGKLLAWYDTHGAASQFAVDTTAYQVGNVPDRIINFSSRGPGVGNVLKPDIAAPGVNILAQGYGLGTGEERHLGFGQVSGTSMAAPHVTGAAALLKQIHPDWSPAWIKSALMSTSKYLGIYNENGTPAQPLDMGAGRLDLTNAADPGVILDPPSLSFGLVPMGMAKSLKVTVTSVADTTETYALSTLYTGRGFDALTTVEGMSFEPASITLAPGESAEITVTWDTVTSKGEGDNQGFLILRSANYEAHMPAWMRVTYAPKPTVLEADLTLAADTDYTVAAAGELATIEPVVLVDDNSAPEAGNAHVRFVHLSPDAPNVDIAVTGGPVLFANVPFKGFAGYAAVPAGTYDLEARIAGTDVVALALPGVTLEAGKVYTVFAVGKVVGPNGKKLSALVDVQDPSAPPAGKARVRVLHAVPDAPAVSVFVNDGLAFFKVDWKQLTGYATLAAGTYNVKVKPALGQVLIIDNDASTTLGLPNYTPYYTATLDELGITYDVWDADANFGKPVTIPDATYLSQYEAIIYQTGDNFSWNGRFTVATPPTALDQNRLVEYVNQGGTILAFGQDLSSVTSTGGNPANQSFFYAAVLGADFLQDSVNNKIVFEDSAQLLTGLPGTPFSNTSFDISARGDGAANQFYVDEIKSGCYDPDRPEDCAPYFPLLKYSVGGNNIEEGFVALAHRDFPTLERPGISYLGKSIYFAFGLEGVNSDTGFNTRADLLDSALAWAWDETEATIKANVKPVGQVSYFTAMMDSTYGGDGVFFRWDFGDGTPFTRPYRSATAGHTYTAPGTYTVRVEATNALGTKAIAEIQVTVEGGFTNPVTESFGAVADTFIHAGLPASNFGDWFFMTVGGSDIARSLLRFDLSSIASNYPVDQAVLKVWVDAVSGGGTAAALRAYEVTTPWAEGSATWNAPWTVKGGDYVEPAAASQPISGASVGTWVMLDITPLVQKWVADPAANNGVMLRLRAETSWTQFNLASREYFVSANAPVLEVTYRTP